MQRITPCLWFDTQAEEAAAFYTSLLPDSAITHVERYPPGGRRPPTEAMLVRFQLAGQGYMALNGGPEFTFTEAISLHVACETQEEVDRLWAALCEGGEPGPCGWLKDRYGLSWQIVPAELPVLMADPDPEKARRVTEAMLQMSKLDVEALRRAHRGD
jgi:predicted 3-demethylubiquinone-9 3-methyltransferase (glyoxalase superfamily)